jgi:hypothetical protein
MTEEEFHINYTEVIDRPMLPQWATTTIGIVCLAFYIWMFVDCYRRLGPNGWLVFFIIFPFSTLIYFLTHINQILRGGSGGAGGLFGPSLKTRITRAQNQLRISDTVAARAELADLYYENGQFAECEAEYRRILAGEPGNLEGLYHIGLCRMRSNDAAGALEFLQKVMEKDRKLRFGKAWLCYTDCLIAVGRKDEALEERKKLSRAFPRPLTEYAYAQALADAGQKEKAREVLDDMLATSGGAPSEDRVWLRKGKDLLRAVAS